MLALAYAALFLWPVVAVVLFRKLGLAQALIATILWGYLLLPETVGIDLPILPPYDKTLAPTLAATVLAWAATRRAAREEWFRARREAAGTGARVVAPRVSYGRLGKLVPLLTVVLLLVPVLTYMTNNYPIYLADRVLQPIKVYDIFSMSMNVVVTLMPMFLARRYLATPEARLTLLRYFVIAGLVYTVFILYEVRMSPQLNRTLYGFFAHSWVQHIRDGFRPIVFLAHGLRVGIFMAMAVLAAATLVRHASTGAERMRWIWALVVLLGALTISRNLGALMIAVALLPFVLFAPRKLQGIAAVGFGLLVLFYPIARGSGLVPANQIVETLQPYAPDRSESLAYRLRNEDVLMARANQKPVAGWGLWGRNMEYDPDTGRIKTVVDGSWVIVIGTRGWLGYLSYFGLLCLPLIFMGLRARKLELDPVDMGLLMILCANLIDLIPNSSNGPLMWLVCGLVWARYEAGPVSRQRAGDTGGRFGRAGPRRRAPDRGAPDRGAPDSTAPDSTAPEAQDSATPPKAGPGRPRPGPRRAGVKPRAHPA